MREIVHMQAGQCGNQIGAKVLSQYPIPRAVSPALLTQVLYKEDQSSIFSTSNQHCLAILSNFDLISHILIEIKDNF